MIALIVKSTLITIALRAIIGSLRRASASTRHLVLAAGFAALAALPAASALLPALMVDVPLPHTPMPPVERPAVADATVRPVLPFAPAAAAAPAAAIADSRESLRESIGYADQLVALAELSCVARARPG
jgi:hypothetical protein